MKKKILALTAALFTAFMYAGCKMEVTEAEAVVPFVAPYISLQPASHSYYNNGDYDGPPTLRVEAEGWKSGDGRLTIQWYTFATIADYVKGDVEEIQTISGAAEDELDLADLATPLKTAAGSRNYFYAVVTNNNGAANIGGTRGSVQSEVAVISFNTAGKPAIPIITSRPSNALARYGSSLNPPLVRVRTGGASGVKSEDLSYEWIYIDNTSAVDGEFDFAEDADGLPLGASMKETVVVDGEEEEQIINSPVLQVSPGALKLGLNYFYVKITHSSGTDSVVEYSIPARLEITRALRAQAPVINGQPRAALYFTAAAAAPLEVEASSPDFGELSYQWYRNDSATSTINLTKSGTRVGANSASFTPDLASNPNAHYYVVVTNTNANVTGARTATATSRSANVRLASAAAAPATVNSTITIGDLNTAANRYNYVRGYGGMEVAWANFPETFPADTELQYDPDRLGYNILRIMMPVSNVNIDVAMDDLVNVTKRRPHYYDNVKIVNKYGGYVAAAPWSPPKEWKSNNSINGGGYLRPQYYNQYAAYLKQFAQHMYNRGAPIYCISIQNEPNYTAGYDGCEWTGNEMRDFFKQVGTFTEGVKGWGGGRQIPRVLTMNGESANNPDINWPAVDDAAAYKHIDVFARHVYGERLQSFWNHKNFVQRTDKKEVWMTEHNINSANASGYPNDSQWNLIWRFMNDIDLVMRINNENAFVWWASKRFYSMVGDGQYNSPDGVALPRGWGLSHYSKYTIGMDRVAFSMSGAAASGGNISIAMGDSRSDSVVNGTDNDMDNISARVTAYASADGSEISLVMWTPTLDTGSGGHNLGNIAIGMPPGFTIGSATAIRSRRPEGAVTRYHESYPVGVSQDRLTAYVTLNNSEIMSVKFTKE